ncbi:unnamed protein product [Strongylus vulgaris]|uniref:7TM GPCR serpentine receptor class x (Srx) domain-containing protein n=1 Tax=Strongylus vulgaris TaxID=40348 RepID=A0A3P7KDD3_STRVU|nr:unnamed protein product [Strongylus vulgaris]
MYFYRTSEKFYLGWDLWFIIKCGRNDYGSEKSCSTKWFRNALFLSLYSKFWCDACIRPMGDAYDIFTAASSRRSELSSQLVGKILGQINIMFWDVCVYSHLLISVNRIVAITLPRQASNLFNFKRTLCLMMLVWFIGFCHIIPYFWWNSCYIRYNATQWVFEFANTQCGFVISTYTDNYTSTAVTAVIIILDCTTLVKLRNTNKAIKSGQMGSVKHEITVYVSAYGIWNDYTCPQFVQFFVQVV